MVAPARLAPTLETRGACAPASPSADWSPPTTRDPRETRGPLSRSRTCQRLPRRPHRVAVNLHRVVGAHRVPARETHRDGDTRTRRPLEHQLVTPPQPF